MARANSAELNSANLLYGAEERRSVTRLVRTRSFSLMEEQVNKRCEVRTKLAEGERAALKLLGVRKAAY